MSRHGHTRVSRPLMAFLGLTIAVGAGVYIHNVKKARASEARESAAADHRASDSGSQGSASPGRSSTGMGATPVTLVTQAPAGQSPALAGHPAAPIAAAHPEKAAGPDSTEQPDASQSSANPVVVALAAGVSDPAPELPSSPASAAPLTDGKAKMDSGDLLGARLILNAALQSGNLNSADAQSARQLLSQINQTVIFSKKRFADDPFQTSHEIASGERLARIADRHKVTWELLCKVNGLVNPRKIRAGQWIKIPMGPFYAVVNKAAFRLDVYQGSAGGAGSLFVTSFPVGLGKDNSTPTGLWAVQQGSKAHPATYYSPRGEGVIAADDPKNPLGGYWIGITGLGGNALEKTSYGIHGTIDPDSIGKEASLGCIRLRHEDIAALYDLLVDGHSKVLVKD
ncbi:MAG TPA: L,D-transpeptidase family protein [Tepidisphaeraceae bacterium]|nr:L,D-transpeptidase family protein [Tepidisphaeraceae bacterium]